MKKGDLLYKCFNGELEVVEFIKEQIADGASVPTLIIRHHDGTLYQCSTDMYFKTPKEAYQEFLKRAIKHLPEIDEQILKLKNQRHEIHKKIIDIEYKLKECQQ